MSVPAMTAFRGDSYTHMSEQPRKFNKLFNGLEKAEDFTDSFYNVTQNVQDLKEESEQFNDDRKEFIDNLKKNKDSVDRVEEINDRRIEFLPIPTEADKLESEDN